MATISGGVCNTYIHMDLIVTETAVSVANNTSTLSWRLVGYMGSGGTSAHWYSNSYHAINVNINGTAVYSLANTTQKSISIGTDSSQSSPVTVASGTVTVPHNNDGSKSCNCMFSCVYRYNSAFSWKGSTSVKLSVIARATQPTVSASSVDMGSGITINMPRAVAGFTHTLTYKFGNLSGTIGSGLGTSKTWTVPLDFANQIPSATSAKCTVTCKTYNGSTVIGAKTVTFTAAVPSSIIPAISNISYDDPTGYAGKYGGFVIGKSKLKVSVTAGGAYGSKIQSYSIKANGKTLTVNNSDFGIYTGGTSVTATVIDSRGRGIGSTVKIPSQAILSYAAPKVSVSVCRCNSGGTADSAGAYMKITVSGTITALNSKNTKSFEISYKKSVESTWTKYSAYTGGYTYSASVVIAADSNYSYDVRVTAKDDFETSTAAASVPTAYVLIDYRHTGKGIAFGKVSEHDNFDVNMDMTLRGKLSVTDAISAASFKTTSGNVEAAANIYAGAMSDTVTRSVYARNSLRSIRMLAGSNGVIGLYNDTNDVYILQSSTANAIQIGESTKTGSVTLSHTSGRFIANGNGVEIFGGTPYIDFHFGSSGQDYTSRIIESESGVLMSMGTFGTNRNIRFGFESSSTTFAVTSKWKDGNQHNVVERNADGLSSFFGWAGSDTYATRTVLRGRSIEFNAAGDIIPSNDNKNYLGNSAHRFKQIFAATGAISTSDRNQKRNIVYDLDKMNAVFDSLKPCSFYHMGGDRMHFGLVAQDVEQALADNGMSINDIGLVCRDHMYHDGETGEKIYHYNADGAPEYRYGLRYEELHGLVIIQVQQLKEEVPHIRQLEKRMKEAEGKIDELEKKIDELTSKFARYVENADAKGTESME